MRQEPTEQALTRLKLYLMQDDWDSVAVVIEAMRPTDQADLSGELESASGF